ncbi:MAG: twin-arginine translocation signal domain-containing protein, partial [Betaproteobacteria bacterium]
MDILLSSAAPETVLSSVLLTVLNGDQKMPNELLGRQPNLASQPRRDFLKQAGALALAASGVPFVSGESAAAPDNK